MESWQKFLAFIMAFAASGLGLAAGPPQSRPGTVIVPPTSVEHPQDIGKRAHTNFLIFVPAANSSKKPSPEASSGPSGETPGSLACVYQLLTESGNISPDCAISAATAVPSGGSKVIAIVDAYDYPTAQNDFAYFSKQFNLPATGCDGTSGDSCLKVVYASGTKPSDNCGWAQEEALDIEWAHAMAPNAQIILVEAASNSNSDLLQAVSVASGLVHNAGGGEVSMSWGGNEFRGEGTLDSYFTTPLVTYFASSGDSGGKVIWPSASPDVISAGGTSINRDANGNFVSESTWSSAGGGTSREEPIPSYQSSIYSLDQILGNSRGTPDISFDSNPYTGVSVYDTTSCQGLSGWLVFGGTSVASPSLAGIANLSGAFAGGWDDGTNTTSEQNKLYNSYKSVSSGGTVCSYGQTSAAPLYDVTSGSAGRNSATGCWDLASGMGAPRGVDAMTGASAASFSLSVSSTSLSVAAGGTSSTSPTLTVTPSGTYSGSVSLGFTAPAASKISVGFTPTTVSGTTTWSSNLTVTAGSGATNGTYTVTITGTDTSNTSLTSSTTISVTVTGGSSSSGGGFTLGDSAGTMTVPVGSSGSDTISVNPSGGFTGSVSLSISGLPKFANGSFSVNPVTISSTTASSLLTIKTNRHISPGGPYTVTITGTDTSGTAPSQSITIKLTIQ